MSSKFVTGDHVRVTNPQLQEFDRTGVVAGYAEIACEPASQVQLDGIDFSVPFKQSSLTLADPDVHTVLDQMDAESAPDAFTVGERVMIRGHVGSYGGRFGEVTGSEDDGAVEWLVRLDGNPVRVPFSEDELVRITPTTSKGMDEREIDGEYERRGSVVPNRRSVVLQTAEKLINGDRARDYGEPAENFGRIADLWNAQFGKKLRAPFTAGDVALALVHLKLSRLANTPGHEDSFVDAIGYLALGAEIAEGP